jgi:glycosyltransferase involved in cell wall biosynthesis
MRTFNGASYVREQLDSIFGQTRLPDDLIACDDDSADASASILEEYAARSPFPMKVLVNKPRLGPTPNLNQVIGLCSGDIIAFSDQDDIWQPHKLASIEQRFEADPDLGFVFSNASLINERSEPVAGDLWSRFNFDEHRQSLLRDARGYDLLLSRSFMTGATAAFRSTFRSLCLPLPVPDLPNFMHDRWIFVLIAAVSRIDFIEDKLMSYRVHAQQEGGVANLPKLVRYALRSPRAKEAFALSVIRERLTTSSTWPIHSEFFHALEVRQQHIAALAAFPRNPLGRLKALAAEYRSGRYQRYPGGHLDALRDLVVG